MVEKSKAGAESSCGVTCEVPAMEARDLISLPLTNFCGFVRTFSYLGNSDHLS